MLEALSTTVTEGGSVTFNVGYTGVLHLQSSLYVTVTAPSRSATGKCSYKNYTTCYNSGPYVQQMLTMC